jgi:rare lipoprotein A (peptidoglycan hydrolase)
MRPIGLLIRSHSEEKSPQNAGKQGAPGDVIHPVIHPVPPEMAPKTAAVGFDGPCSSAVEHPTFNRQVVGSIPTAGTRTLVVLYAVIVLQIVALLLAPHRAEAAWKPATATWYGPGFYGNTTACGQRYTQQIRGTAHMALPCGSKVTICKPVGRFRRCVAVRVIDRGAFHPGNFDLSARTAMDLCRCSRPYTQRVSWRRGW